MRARPAALGPLLGTTLAAALAGCDPDPPAGASAGASAGAAAPPTALPAPATAPPPANTASAAPAPAAEHLQLLELTLTSAVKDKEPADALDAAPAGGRTYAHIAVRNRTGEARRLQLVFEVNGRPRTELELDVEESWRWRTWGYNTLRDGEKGELTVIVTEDGGPELARVTVPIRASSGRLTAPSAPNPKPTQ